MASYKQSHFKAHIPRLLQSQVLQCGLAKRRLRPRLLLQDSSQGHVLAQSFPDDQMGPSFAIMSMLITNMVLITVLVYLLLFVSSIQIKRHEGRDFATLSQPY